MALLLVKRFQPSEALLPLDNGEGLGGLPLSSEKFQTDLLTGGETLRRYRHVRERLLFSRSFVGIFTGYQFLPANLNDKAGGFFQFSYYLR